MTKGERMIVAARSICQVIDGINVVISEMKQDDKKIIIELSSGERKQKLIVEYVKELIDNGHNISFNDEYTAFKKNF